MLARAHLARPGLRRQRSLLQQAARSADVAIHDGYSQRPQAHAGLQQRRRRGCREQQAQRAHVPPPSGVVGRCATVAVKRRGVCAACQERSRARCRRCGTAQDGCMVQRRAAHAVGGAWVCAAAEQGCRAAGVPALHRMLQRCNVVNRRVWAGACRQRCMDPRQVTVVHSKEQLPVGVLLRFHAPHACQRLQPGPCRAGQGEGRRKAVGRPGHTVALTSLRARQRGKWAAPWPLRHGRRRRRRRPTASQSPWRAPRLALSTLSSP